MAHDQDDKVLTEGDHLDLTNTSERPLVLQVVFADGGTVSATLPLGGSISFVVGKQDARIKLHDAAPDEATIP